MPPVLRSIYGDVINSQVAAGDITVDATFELLDRAAEEIKTIEVDAATKTEAQNLLSRLRGRAARVTQEGPRRRRRQLGGGG